MGNMNNVIIGGAAISIIGNLGYIRDGITVAPTVEHYFVEAIEGFPGRHRAARTSEDYAISFTLEEPTLQKFRIGWDITNATVIGTSSTTLEFGGDSVSPNERNIIITGVAPDQGSGYTTRLILFDRAVASSPGEMKITDFEETKIPCTFNCMYDSGDARIGYYIDS